MRQRLRSVGGRLTQLKAHSSSVQPFLLSSSSSSTLAARSRTNERTKAWLGRALRQARSGTLFRSFDLLEPAGSRLRPKPSTDPTRPELSEVVLQAPDVGVHVQNKFPSIFRIMDNLPKPLGQVFCLFVCAWAVALHRHCVRPPD